MPRIVFFHPKIVVCDGQRCFAIRTRLDDWYSNGDILRSLALETGTSTIGELVEFLRANKCSAYIENLDGQDHEVDYDWSDMI